ncbi:MAG: hypothetical protein VW124_24865 [Paracoccaceae bacterium]
MPNSLNLPEDRYRWAVFYPWGMAVYSTLIVFPFSSLAVNAGGLVNLVLILCLLEKVRNFSNTLGVKDKNYLLTLFIIVCWFFIYWLLTGYADTSLALANCLAVIYLSELAWSEKPQKSRKFNDRALGLFGSLVILISVKEIGGYMLVVLFASFVSVVTIDSFKYGKSKKYWKSLLPVFCMFFIAIALAVIWYIHYIHIGMGGRSVDHLNSNIPQIDIFLWSAFKNLLTTPRLHFFSLGCLIFLFFTHGLRSLARYFFWSERYHPLFLIGILNIAGNLTLMFLAYLMTFGEGEFIIAHSIDRYISPASLLLMILIFIIAAEQKLLPEKKSIKLVNIFLLMGICIHISQLDHYFRKIDPVVVSIRDFLDVNTEKNKQILYVDMETQLLYPIMLTYLGDKRERPFFYSASSRTAKKSLPIFLDRHDGELVDEESYFLIIDHKKQKDCYYDDFQSIELKTQFNSDLIFFHGPSKILPSIWESKKC